MSTQSLNASAFAEVRGNRELRLYDPEPNHVWNRLYRCFYRREGRDGREYGYDELDPLLWWSTKYLLQGTRVPSGNHNTQTNFFPLHAER